MGEFTTGTTGEREAFREDKVLRGRIVKIAIICILSFQNVWQSISSTSKLVNGLDDLSISNSPRSDRNNAATTMPLLENYRASSPPSLSVQRINDITVEEPTTTRHWLLDYTVWHSQVRQNLNETNWKDYQYLVLKCPQGHICGGASDRLKWVPLLVYLASLANPKRLFFIHWTKPAPLEEFLVPPPAAKNNFFLDWRLPPWLAQELEAEKPNAWYRLEGDDNNVTTFQNTWESLDRRMVNIDRMLLTRKQELYYTGLIAEYSSIWKALFTPSPNVQMAIEKVQRELGITSKKYNAVHVRARYISDTVHEHAEQNAINCLLEHRNNEISLLTTTYLPVYVASDSADTVRQAVQYGRDIGVRVVGCENTTEPLHLDRGNSMLEKSNDWEGRPPSDFYPTFVDLYLLADSQCIARGVGGYGKWASLIGPSSCNIDYRERKCSAP